MRTQRVGDLTASAGMTPGWTALGLGWGQDGRFCGRDEGGIPRRPPRDGPVPMTEIFRAADGMGSGWPAVAEWLPGHPALIPAMGSYGQGPKLTDD